MSHGWDDGAHREISECRLPIVDFLNGECRMMLDDFAVIVDKFTRIDLSSIIIPHSSFSFLHLIAKYSFNDLRISPLPTTEIVNPKGQFDLGELGIGIVQGFVG
jgi:hypothetical protein